MTVEDDDWCALESNTPMAKRKKATKTLADKADKHELYQWSVQSPESDVDLWMRFYKSRHRRAPKHFREDFCGTALLAATWVSRGGRYSAEGFDIDPEPLDWGIVNNIDPLGKAAKRVVLHQADVRAPSERAPDVRCAQNFSWFVFKTRAELLAYFSSAYEDLASGGLLVLDIFGGPQAVEEMFEESPVEDEDDEFVYVWDQDGYWPVTGDYLAHIHFKFPDGSRLDHAFSYDWRLWTIPETIDVLRDAGFDDVEIYWEQIGEDGESGNGVYEHTRRGENWLSWVAYIVAHKA